MIVPELPADIAELKRRIGDFIEDLTASTESWAETLAADPGGPTSAVPLVKESNRPPSPAANYAGG